MSLEAPTQPSLGDTGSPATQLSANALIARNAAFNLLALAASAASAAVAVPLLLRQLGAERFGILSLAWVVLGYFTVFDLGIDRATTRFLADVQRRSPEIVGRYFSTSVVLLGLLGLLAGIALLAATPQLSSALGVRPDLLSDAQGTLQVVALILPIVFVGSAPRAALEASQRFDLVNLVAVPYAVLTFALPAAAALAGQSLPVVVATLAFNRLWATSAYYWSAHRIGRAAFDPRSFDGGVARILVGYGGWISVSNAVGPILVYADRFVIVSVLTIDRLGYYVIPFELVSRVLLAPAAIALALFPYLSSSGAIDSEDSARSQALALKFLLFALAVPALVLLVLGGDILTLWLGVDFAAESTSVLRVLTLGVLANAAASVPLALIQARGRPDMTAKVHLLELPPFLTAAWLLVSAFGLVGAASYWSLRALADAGLMFLGVRRLLPTSWSAYGKVLMPRTVSTVLLFIFIALALGGLQIPIVVRIAAVALVLACLCVVGWRYALDARERQSLIALGRR